MSDLERNRLLVIDDEKGLRDMLVYTLGKRGFRVVPASTGEEGLVKAQAAHFDVVICDIMMPGIGGVATLKALKESCPNTEVVMVTGFATLELAVECIKLGAFDFIAKPYELGPLEAILNRAAGKSQLTTEIP